MQVEAPGGHHTPKGQSASPRERVAGAPGGDLRAGGNRLGPSPELQVRASLARKGAGARPTGSALVPLTVDPARASGGRDGALRGFGPLRREHQAGAGTAVRGRCVGTRRGGPAPGHRAGALFQPGWRRSDGAERPERRRRPPRTPGRSARLGGAQAAGLSAFAGRLWLFPSLHRREFITQRLLSQIHEGRKEGLDVGGLAGYRGEAESRLDSELSPSLCFLLVALRRFPWRLWCSGA